MERKVQTIIRNRNQPAVFVRGGAEQQHNPAAPRREGSLIPNDVLTISEAPAIGSLPPESSPINPNQPQPGAGDSPMDVSQVEPQIAQIPAYNPNAPASADARTGAVRQSVLAPYLSQIEANRKKMDVLKTMPVTDKDGRTRSGFAAFLQSLGENPQLRNVRSWGDLAKSLTFSAAVGVGGAIDKTWNERQKRDSEMAKIEAENQTLQKQAESDLRLAGQESVIENRTRSQNRQDEIFENRVNQQKYKRVQDRKKEVLAPIFKRGFFYQDSASPEELQRLEAAGVVLDDFDTTKKPYNDEGGVRKVWDIRRREYVPAKGDEPDEPLVATEIDGVRINLKPSEFANYKAQEGRTRYETAVRDADNEQEYKNALQKWEDDERKRSEDKVKLINDGNTKNTEAIEQENLAADYETEADRLAEDNATQAVKLRSEAKKARARASVLKTESSSLLNRAQNSKPAAKPVKQAKLPVYISTVQTVKTGTVSEAEFNRNLDLEKVTDPEKRAKIIADARAAKLIK